MLDQDGRGVAAVDFDVQPRGGMSDPDHYWIAYAFMRDDIILEKCGRPGTNSQSARDELSRLLSPEEWAGSLNALAKICRARNYLWWRSPTTGEPVERNKGELLALIHSEISECLEGVRKNLQDDHLPHRKQEEVELADALIRIFDYAGGFGLDIGGAFAEKMAYNAERADHKPENRVKDGGKGF